MTDKDCEQDNAELRSALEAEHRVVKKVQEAMVEGLKPDAPAGETLERIWEAVGEDVDPGEDITRAENALRRGRSMGERDADSTSAIPVYDPAHGDGS